MQQDLKLPQAAIRLGVSVATVRRWINLEQLPARRVGRTIRIPSAALEAWYENHSMNRTLPRPVSDTRGRIAGER